jgi:hypothetical protein
MPRYAVVRDGVLSGVFDGPPMSDADAKKYGYIEVGADVNELTHRVAGNGVEKMPKIAIERRKQPPPHPCHWDSVAMDWIDTRSDEYRRNEKLERLNKQIAALEQQQLRPMRVLLLGTAPPEQVERERAKLTELEGRIANLRSQMA